MNLERQSTRLAANLLLGQDDLAALRVVGVGDGVVEEADRAHDVAHLADLGGEVRGITDDELAPGDLALRLDADDLAALHDDLLDRLVQHVGTAVNGAEPVVR